MRASRVTPLVALIIMSIPMMGGMAACPRDPHPERTPCPAPSGERCMQTGRQPAPGPGETP